MSQTLPLDIRTPIVDENGMPTEQFMKMWQKLIGQANFAAGALMPDPAPVTIYKDYTGTVAAGELPRAFAVKRYLYGADVSARTRWFLSVKSGMVTASIDQTGLITITATTGGVLTLKSVRDNITLQCDFPVNIVIGSPPASGSGGGTSISTSIFTAFASTTHASTTADLVVTAGSGGIVNLQATLDVRTVRSAPESVYAVYGIWRWWNGTAYVDVATEVQSNPDCEITKDPLRSIYYLSSGTLTVAASKTGLAAASSNRFQFFARNFSGTRSMTFVGTATATGA